MKKLAILFFGAFALATSAQAAVYDFIAAEAAVGEGGYTDLNTNDASWAGILPGGLIATGYNNNVNLLAGIKAFAYLDGPAGGPGGLGVCKNLDIDGECDPAGDDNVRNFEVLRIDLTAGGQDIIAMSFEDHGVDLSGVNVWYRVNSSLNADWVETTFGALSSLLLSNVDTLDLREAETGGAKFYLATLEAVPLPAAVWLFGTAMLGLFGLRRKNKSDALAA